MLEWTEELSRTGLQWNFHWIFLSSFFWSSVNPRSFSTLQTANRSTSLWLPHSKYDRSCRSCLVIMYCSEMHATCLVMLQPIYWCQRMWSDWIKVHFLVVSASKFRMGSWSINFYLMKIGIVLNSINIFSHGSLIGECKVWVVAWLDRRASHNNSITKHICDNNECNYVIKTLSLRSGFETEPPQSLLTHREPSTT